MRTLSKNPFRLVRYIALVFGTEIVRGDANKRRRFLGRILRCAALPLGLYALTKSLFMGWLAVSGLFLSTATQKRNWRYRQWRWAIAGFENRAYLSVWTESRYEGGPKIVVLGMGSVGDLLQITPVLRALREKLPRAHICLLHRSPAAKLVLRGNPYVDSIALADFYHFAQIKQAIKTEGAADLAVEIESISYVITYTRAPQDLQHPEFKELMPDAFFAKAEASRALWKVHPPVFPRKEEKFTWPPEWRPYHYLDVLGTTGNLQIDRNSDLDFYLESLDDGPSRLLPRDQPYITVQNGGDADVMNWARATGQYPTKLLPLKTWARTIELLSGRDFRIVQLGTLDDEIIDGISLDLRGKTTLREAAIVLKHALCNVGPEGGLIHLARAMHTKSVVLFGPTSIDFLGYPQNTNLIASECTSCWWTTKDWFIYCPRGLEVPECMGSYQAETIADAILRITSSDDRRQSSMIQG